MYPTKWTIPERASVLVTTVPLAPCLAHSRCSLNVSLNLCVNLMDGYSQLPHCSVKFLGKCAAGQRGGLLIEWNTRKWCHGRACCEVDRKLWASHRTAWEMSCTVIQQEFTSYTNLILPSHSPENIPFSSWLIALSSDWQLHIIGHCGHIQQSLHLHLDWLSLVWLVSSGMCPWFPEPWRCYWTP